VKGSGAEAHAKGPYLKWQNCGGKVAKALGERGDPSPPSSTPPQRERGSCHQAAALTHCGWG